VSELNQPEPPDIEEEPHPIGALALLVVIILIIISLWVSVYTILLQRAGS
jgi:hypothetical protein